MARGLTGLILSSLLVLMSVQSVEAGRKYARWAGGDIQIRGYDTTAYFKAGKPAVGQSRHVVTWNGGTWYFRTAKEATTFRASPARYTPRFGAYCTGGLSQRHVVNGNPTIWRMHKGKLYMFYAIAGAKRFDKNPEGVIAAARDYAKTVGIREH